MKKSYLLTLTILAALFCTNTNAKKIAPIDGTSKASAPDMNTDKRLSFIENKGQIKDQNGTLRHDIQYSLTATNGLNIFIGDGAIHYQFSKAVNNTNKKDKDANSDMRNPTPENTTYSMYRMDVELVGANKRAVVVTEEKQDYYENYFIAGTGQDGAIAHAYNRITYKNIYPNIDWVLYTTKGELKHEFVVHRGGNVSDIQLRYGGATKLRIDIGALTASTPQGTITEQAPYTYTKNGGTVQSSFKLVNNILSYQVGSYEGDVVIDPTLVWATYNATDVYNIFYSVVTDNAGKIYMSGYAGDGPGIATSGAYQTTVSGGINATLTVFNSFGTRLWATYYGGSSGSNGMAVAVDNSGNIYLGGATYSADSMATPGAHQTTLAPNGDGFLAKFNSAGSRLWGTYYGGGQADDIRDMTVDDSGNVYITGFARSNNNIATPGSYQPTKPGVDDDAFIAKFDSMGTRKWGTYFGGTGHEWGLSIKFDRSGYLYLAGYTESSTGIATSGAYQTVYAGLRDGFIAKFSRAGSLQWATYLGGADADEVSKVTVDDSGHLYIGGFTRSSSGIATSGAYDETCSVGTLDGFLSKFNGSGTGIWSTYFGGSNDDVVHGLCAVGDGKIFITGNTNSPSGIATDGAPKSTHGGGAQRDGFFEEFSAGGNRVWGTYYGGTNSDNPTDMAAGPGGKLYVIGVTQSPTGIATTGAHLETYGSGVNAFLARYDTARLNISGTLSICSVGGTTSLFANYPGGSWSSGSPGIATVNATSGIVTSVSGGTASITYILSGGSYSTITVSTTLTSITGPSSVCVSATITLSNATSGGTWSSSNPAVATVGSASGIVVGAGAGTAIITYSMLGCIATKVVSVAVASSAGTLSGTMSACVGNTGTLASTITGGVWTSATTAVATIGSASGTFTGVSPGTATMSYTVTSCGTAYSMAVVTINAAPAAITGTTTVSYGGTTTLSCATTGGTWSSSNPIVATVSTAGVLSGISVGGATITYMLASGCYTTLAITVATDPIDPITGPLSLCMGTTGVLGCITPSGISWTSSDPTVATVGITSGVVTPVSPGTATITFTVSSGAYTTSVVTVYPLPSSISGSTFLCTGSSTSLSSATSGGTWASSNAGVASIGTSGNVTGVTAGTSTITYTLSTGCKTTTTVSVGVMPAVITGTPLVCVGNSVSLASATPGGTWSSDNTAIATISGTGLTTGIGAGTTTISYLLSSGCARTIDVTVNPALDDNTGVAIVCVSLTTTLSNTTTGGTWSSSNTSRATVNATTGLVTGINPGTVNITYTVSTGCIAITNVTVNAPLASISGIADICVGTTTTFTHPVSGGTWSSSNTAMATVGAASGVITGISAGAPTITYTAMGCFKTKPITVNGGSAAISGNLSICQGSTSVLSCSTPGGTTWVSSNTPVATVGLTSGLVTGISVGTASISYLASSGCTSTTVVTVIPLPTAISGTFSVCQAATTALASIGTTGGTWVSSNTSKATIGSSSGVVTGVNGGTANITYTWTNTCKRAATVTVNPLPAAGAIVGAGVLAVGATQTLSSSSPGGTWASSNPAKATIVAGTGFMTGISTGTITITYTNTNSCGSAAVTRIFNIVTPRPGGAVSTGGRTGLFSIYPNPTVGTVTIESAVKGTFNVYTIDGRQVGSYPIDGAVTSLTLPEQLAAGIYIGRFVGDDGNVQMIRLVYEH